MCSKPKCNSQKQITFTLTQLNLDDNGFENTMSNYFKGRQKAWDERFKPEGNTLAPVIGTAVEAKSKNLQVLQVGQASTNISKSMSGGKFLSLTDMHNNG